MRVHYLSHVPFEKLGTMETWLEQRGARLSATRFYQGEPLPEPEQLDTLIVMGGPMGADDEARYPWMAAEKRFIEQCIAADKKVLGVCLGAQLIARVLGAPVTANPEPEIGWSLFEGFEGRGYATEAALEARDWAYRSAGWTTAISLIAPQNAASKAVATRLGAAPEGRFVHPEEGWEAEIWRHPSAAELAA